MKRWDARLATIGVVSLVVSTWVIHKTAMHGTNLIIVAGGCRVPATVIDPPAGATQRAAIVLHGLGANRHVMRILGETLAAEGNLRAYTLDLPGHGDNTDAFSFPHVEQCAAAVVEKLTRDGTITPKQTAIVGHSMGGAVAIRLADEVPVAATVSLSPAPMIAPRRMPANLLVFSAQYDFPQLRQEAQILSQAAGGERIASEDFVQLRAFDLTNVAGANHTGVVVDPKVAEQAAKWIDAAFDPATLRSSGAWKGEIRWNRSVALRHVAGYGPKNSFVAAWAVRIAPFGGLVGLLLMFPLGLRLAAESLAAKIDEAQFPGQQPDERKQPFAGLKAGASIEHNASRALRGVKIPPLYLLVLVEGGLFAFGGVLVLKFDVPLKFLHMYSGDYLGSLLVVFGVLLLAFNWRAAKYSWSLDGRALVVGAVLGFATMLAFGAWVNWRLADLWLNAARWMRFAGLLPFLFTFSFAEELALGPVPRGKQRFLRFVVFLLLRSELWLAAVFAFYALGSGNVLIAVLAPALAGFSALQRMGTDAIHLRTGSALGAAVFGAILGSWLIAAIFPLT